MKKWYLKSQALKKFYLRHPWVFSSDLGHSPKNVSPGEIVELYNESGEFLARGYGHPNTLISFRTLTRDVNQQVHSQFIYYLLKKAFEKRKLSHLTDASFRFIFAEADYLPGLIIDRYKLSGDRQVFVVQSSTAGMELLLPIVFEALERFVKNEMVGISWDLTGIIIANDSKSRLLEGLESEPKRIFKDVVDVNWNEVKVQIQSSTNRSESISMFVDFLGGQKTGFFLDQRSNIELVVRACAEKFASSPKPLKVLDLCCYIGQWSSQLAHLFTSLKVKVDFTCVDGSEKALGLAQKNLLEQGIDASDIILKKLDVLKDLGELADQTYDIVICDPPAFIKKRQDIENGERAYVKLNRDAIKKTAANGFFMSCSCSGHLDDLKFRDVLVQATSKTGRPVEWLWRGAHSPDHPELPEFPQGTYLKSWLGWAR